MTSALGHHLKSKTTKTPGQRLKSKMTMALDHHLKSKMTTALSHHLKSKMTHHQPMNLLLAERGDTRPWTRSSQQLETKT